MNEAPRGAAGEDGRPRPGDGARDEGARDEGARDEGAVAGLLSRLDETLERLERTPGATAEAALDAVTMLTEVYGEALSRMMARIPGDAAALVEDDLVGHLLVLHDLHPEPVERRVVRTLERLRPDLKRRGLDAELVGIEGRTARVGMTGGKGGGCAAGAAEEAVREAVLAAAPELTAVEVTPPKAPPAFVPLDALMRPPAAASDGAA